MAHSKAPHTFWKAYGKTRRGGKMISIKSQQPIKEKRGRGECSSSKAVIFLCEMWMQSRIASRLECAQHPDVIKKHNSGISFFFFKFLYNHLYTLSLFLSVPTRRHRVFFLYVYMVRIFSRDIAGSLQCFVLLTFCVQTRTRRNAHILSFWLCHSIWEKDFV